MLGGCTSFPSMIERHDTALKLAAEKSWQEKVLSTSSFELMSFSAPVIAPKESITVYIEGDGFAWVSRSQVSLNPTPITPLTLRLAMAQPEGTAIYLARPCQYVWQDGLCEKKYWTTDRFSSLIVSSLDQALTQLKQQYDAQSITLVGYSGGASLAALLAAKRDDITKLISVAGNLDHEQWTTTQKISPLINSLNPIDHIDRLQDIKQLHFVGEKDEIVPPHLVRTFVRTYNKRELSQVIMIDAFSHSCCWAEQWPTLWQKTQE